MITGTIYNAGKTLEMTQKWEQKKSSGNILKKEVKELSPEEQQLKMYQEQLEREREGNEYSSIYAKIQSGQELSPAEEDKLRAKDPKMYMEYKADRMEQEAYEKKLKNCKTKEEAERLHVNRMNGKLSELKSIVNNPNIPKSEKLKEAQRILGDTTKTAQIFHTFTKSAEFKELPTEEEVMEARLMYHVNFSILLGLKARKALKLYWRLQNGYYQKQTIRGNDFQHGKDGVPG